MSDIWWWFGVAVMHQCSYPTLGPVSNGMGNVCEFELRLSFLWCRQIEYQLKTGCLLTASSRDWKHGETEMSTASYSERAMLTVGKFTFLCLIWMSDRASMIVATCMSVNFSARQRRQSCREINSINQLASFQSIMQMISPSLASTLGWSLSLTSVESFMI